MWRWMLRTSSVFLFSSFVLTSPAAADPHFYVRFSAPLVYGGYGYPGYVYQGYGYPGYAYPGYVYPAYVYPGYVYPRYAYPRYVWRDGYSHWYGSRNYWGGGRYVRPYGRAAWTSGRWSHGGWHGGGGHWRR
jgi:hypothetical protein